MIRTTALFLSSVLTGSAGASGYLSPAHSQLTYSFTCPSGASGHITYSKDFVITESSLDRDSRLSIWINGKYVHNEPQFADALKATNIEQVQASCGIISTLIILETFDSSGGPGEEELKTLIVPVDHSGKPLWGDS